jgi:hypothetical protein
MSLIASLVFMRCSVEKHYSHFEREFASGKAKVGRMPEKTATLDRFPGQATASRILNNPLENLAVLFTGQREGTVLKHFIHLS